MGFEPHRGWLTVDAVPISPDSELGAFINFATWGNAEYTEAFDGGREPRYFLFSRDVFFHLWINHFKQEVNSRSHGLNPLLTAWLCPLLCRKRELLKQPIQD